MKQLKEHKKYKHYRVITFDNNSYIVEGFNDSDWEYIDSRAIKNDAIVLARKLSGNPDVIWQSNNKEKENGS